MNCPVCATQFTPRRGGCPQKYCTRRCGNVAQSRQVRAEGRVSKERQAEYARRYRAKDTVRLQRQEYQRAYYDAHRQACADRLRRWRAANPDRVREQTRRSYAQRRVDPRYMAKARERTRRWVSEHPEAKRTMDTRYRADNPQRVRAYKRRWGELHASEVRVNALSRYHASRIERRALVAMIEELESRLTEPSTQEGPR